jgi:methylated-DNA-protein-cysteine methyltransferase related protein
MSLLFKDVYAVVKLIPKGYVMSYGGVARLCGYPRAPRQVGHALQALPEGSRVPWWRVVNAQGRISNSSTADAPSRQCERLEAEGVVVSVGLKIDMRNYDGEMVVYARLQVKRGGAP